MKKRTKIAAGLLAAATVLPVAGGLTVGTAAAPAQAGTSCYKDRVHNTTGLWGQYNQGVYKVYVYFPRVTPTSKLVDASKIQRIDVKNRTGVAPARATNAWVNRDFKGCIQTVMVRIQNTRGATYRITAHLGLTADRY